MNNLLRPFTFLLLASLFIVACNGDAQETTAPEGCDGVTWGSSIRVEERDGEYVAVMQGDNPDACSTVCGHQQTAAGNEININLYSSRPEDMMCAEVLTPFEAEVPLDVTGLEAGEYTVTLNEDHAATIFTLE